MSSQPKTSPSVDDAIDWDSMPTYSEFLFGSYQYFRDNIQELANYSFVQTFFTDLKVSLERITLIDVTFIALLTIFWTLTRKYATKYVFRPIGEYYGIPQSDCGKMPESAWKFMFYFGTWTSMAYIIFGKSCCQYFHYPTHAWQNHSVNSVMPTDMYTIHIIQLSFYLHSLYTTAFIDLWRKDTPTLMIHHVICVSLLFVSILTKSHRSGLLALFLHDGCDILLEGTKLMRYFRNQSGRIVPAFEIATNIGFGCFTFVWFFSRLYWFPLKQIWIASVYVRAKKISVPFLFPINIMLWMLFIMNIYWFSFIVKLLYKVVTGQVKELEDNREYSDGEKKKEVPEKDESEDHNKSTNGHYYLRRRKNSLNFKDINSGRSQ